MRRTLDRTLFLASASCGVLACAILVGFLAIIFSRGHSALTWSFFTDEMRQAGMGGGIVYNLVGTAILVGTAVVICAPFAIAIALLERVYLHNSTLRRILIGGIYTLNGVPTILFGIFGLIVFVKFFGWGKSWLTGGILLAALILPTVSVALIERIKSMPRKYLDAAAGLGLNESQIIWSVILPQSWGGLLTGLLLGLARAAGETAPIMFTATIFAGVSLPHGIHDSPVLSLPYHIFTLTQDSFDPSQDARLWGAAIVLLMLVLLLSLIALPSRLRIHEEAND